MKLPSVVPWGQLSNALVEPWAIAFLPDGRMLVTEKPGPVWLVSAEGKKIAKVDNTPAAYWQGQNGMHGVYLSPKYSKDQSIYLTYAEPGEDGGAPLLGLNGVSMICHGSSDRRAIKNAVRVCADYVRRNLNKTIDARIAEVATPD